MHIVIDSQKNQVRVQDGDIHQGDIHQFGRRWEARILALLVQAARAAQPLSAAAIQQSLQLHGQQQLLNRTQLKRLFSNVADYLARLPGQPLRVAADPRKSTIGPWHLAFQAPVTLTIDNDQAAAWSHPMLLLQPCIDALHQLISQLLISDAFALYGDYRSAIASLQPTYVQPLTAEGRCLLLLRESMWQKRLGHFDKARELAHRVLATPTPADPGLQTHASFVLHRVAYDEAPVGQSDWLWEAVAPLPPVLSVDWRTQAEWHNLRALLARRRLYSQQHQPAQPDSTVEAEVLSRLALRHLESAIYLGAWQRDWDRLQSYVANYAFHLQNTFSLGLPTSPSVLQVFNWHRLTLAFHAKLEAGKDSAWEFIFLGSFWLDQHAQITTHQLTDPLAQEVEGYSPAKEAFYIQGIARLSNCGDARQLAIAWTLYLRFAQDHMHGKPRRAAQLQASTALCNLLDSHPASLRKTLQEDGYCAYWPDEVLTANH